MKFCEDGNIQFNFLGTTIKIHYIFRDENLFNPDSNNNNDNMLLIASSKRKRKICKVLSARQRNGINKDEILMYHME